MHRAACCLVMKQAVIILYKRAFHRSPLVCTKGFYHAKIVSVTHGCLA